MKVEANAQLGPYTVVAPLGAGGMGEVWRARDTRLDRDVAIKILPADFAANPQFRARFEREAKTISQLNHPNVCTLFDVGHHEGTDYLVMELLEGESLADRLRAGALPVPLVLRHGTEIASALAAAHRQRIVHRDLKPGNVMLTKAGAKLLDFGLAKSGPLLTTTSSISEFQDRPTEHRPLTEQGTILGTFQYMAPEQLEGQEADARSDIFAFGAVLYEMATGRHAFQGKNKTSLIAAIVSSTPAPMSEIAPLAPPALEHVIRKCLAKDPEERWQSVGDVADQLRWIAEAGSRAGEPAPVLARRKTKLRMAWVLHAATALVAIAATLGVTRFIEPAPRLVRSSLLPPEKGQFNTWAGAMALSPDGQRIAFTATVEDEQNMLWVQSLDALSAQPLAGTEGATHPFWSPDGRYVAFFAGGKLRKIEASGGPPQTICDAAGGRGGTWSPDGVILFTPNTSDVIYRVASAGGAPTPVTAFDEARGETSHRFPVFLPDGDHFLFLNDAAENPEDPTSGRGLWIGSLASKDRAYLLATDASARYADSGHVLFLRESALMAQRFDAGSLRLEGEAVPVAENLALTSRWETTFSVSGNGLLVFQSGAGGDQSQIALLDREGKELGLFGKPADYGTPKLSHDGKRVAASIVDPASQKEDVWILDVQRGTSTRLTFDPEGDYGQVWSPDDRFIYFTSTRAGKGDVYRKSSAGTGTEEVVLAGPDWSMIFSFTADGRRASVLVNRAAKTGWDIDLLDMESGESSPFLQTPFVELSPMLSQDGKWLAYSSNESGRQEVYVQQLVGEGGKWQISTDGGTRPRWSRGDRELMFVAPDFKLMTVDVDLESGFSASIPRLLLDPGMRQTRGTQYDVTADGSRLLVNRPLDQPTVAPVTLVQNWTEALKD